MTIYQRAVLPAAIIAATAFVSATPASAQATRTWVSGVGDDVNPCSRTAPCKTFAGAISKTAAKGEINCIDSGGFGAVTIIKAIAIVCDNVLAGIMASGTNGVVVKAGENDAVLLSGLDIEGAGTGVNGVRFITGRSLTIRGTTIRMFGTPDGAGVSNEAAAGSTLIIADSQISDNLTGVRATGSASVTVIRGSAITGNATGLEAQGGAKILSTGDNLFAANGKDGAIATRLPAK